MRAKKAALIIISLVLVFIMGISFTGCKKEIVIIEEAADSVAEFENSSSPQG